MGVRKGDTMISGSTAISPNTSTASLSVLARPKSMAQYRAQIEAPDKTPEDQREQARRAAEGLVATSFIKPILAQLRESNNAAAPFAPTQAEKQFGSLLDNRLSDEIARAARFPIVDRLVSEFTKHLPDAPQTSPSQGIDLSA